ncbi:hypothetical protein E4U42_004401 [Claviceps africana]|uniref:Pre-mRNA-splicing factor n=1 Tax=Claviceps africana TaxID=83212 RepID=A0A8K0J7I8_9HYPO|nr:hypothetical protein E4U42_004401 [Claviceps africana]
MSDPSKSRIAIKLGGPSTSSSTPPSTSRPPPRGSLPPSTLGKRPRQTTTATAALGDESDSDSNSDAEHRQTRHEAITAFGHHGAETVRSPREDHQPPKRPYLIAKQPNRDWRSEMRAHRRPDNNNNNNNNNNPRAAPPQQQHEQKTGRLPSATQDQPRDPDESPKWGLILPQGHKPQADRGGTDDDDKTPTQAQERVSASPPARGPGPNPRPDDEEALNALLGPDKPSGPEKRIPAPSEDDVYRRDAARAGAASTLDDYEAMPVEEFGAALLRGMGWDGQPTGPKAKEVRRRPARLGLGAKESKHAEDLGAWNQKPPRPKLADYRRDESRRKDRQREDSYKRERDRERDRDPRRDRDRYTTERETHRDRRARRQ